jgi:hypothetical protein
LKPIPIRSEAQRALFAKIASGKVGHMSISPGEAQAALDAHSGGVLPLRIEPSRESNAKARERR